MIFSNKSVTWHDPVNAAKYLSDYDLRQKEYLILQRNHLGCTQFQNMAEYIAAAHIAA